MKIARLEVVVQPESQRTTTTELILPSELPTIENEPKVSNAALKAPGQLELDQSETLRLRARPEQITQFQLHQIWQLFSDDSSATLSVGLARAVEISPRTHAVVLVCGKVRAQSET